MMSNFSVGFDDGHHHGRGGCVGDEHRDDGRGQHEPEHGHLRRGSHHKDDPQRDPPMEAAVLDAGGQHEAAEHHEVGGPHVVDSNLVLQKCIAFER